MFRGRRLICLLGGLTTSFLLSSCLSLGGKKEAAVEGPAPPPSAYPDTSGSSMVADGAAAPGNSPVPSAVAPHPSSAAMAATNRAPAATAPVPFSLREGEQLIPHQVQSGENLSSIASKYNTSVARIQSANGMTDTKIFAGKTIQVPTSAAPGGTSQFTPAAVAPSGGAYLAGASAPSGVPTGAYPSTSAAPSVPAASLAPSAPSAPAYPPVASGAGAIAAPPVPTAAPPGYPSTTSYPRTAPTPSSSVGAYQTPTFEASRIQFSN